MAPCFFTDIFVVSSAPPHKYRSSTSICTWLLAPKYFPIHHSPIILPFDTTHSGNHQKRSSRTHWRSRNTLNKQHVVSNSVSNRLISVNSRGRQAANLTEFGKYIFSYSSQSLKANIIFLVNTQHRGNYISCVSRRLHKIVGDEKISITEVIRIRCTRDDGNEPCFRHLPESKHCPT
jgi:hypothetical protein